MTRYGGVCFLAVLMLIVLGGTFPIVHPGLAHKSGVDVQIRVAVYDSLINDYVNEAINPLEYSWGIEGFLYHLDPFIITRADIMKGNSSVTLDNCDVLIIPGSGRPYLDALHPQWKNCVIDFVDQGGGFLGICGGANLASQGFEEKKGLNGILNNSVLGIANIYVNNQQDEEWMYLWKANWQHGLPPILISIVQNKNPIFRGSMGETRNIRYGGGPGMYETLTSTEKHGPIIPLAIYIEELMKTAPLHYWTWKKGWEIQKNVTTDIQGQYAAIATSYGLGRIVLFGPHPEKKTFFGGHIEEFPVRPNMGPFTWHIYNWVNGTL